MLARWSCPMMAMLGLALVSPALAQPPRVKDPRPAGIPRGVATDLALKGERLDAAPRLLLPFPAVVEPLAEGSDAATWRVRITPSPEVPAGAYAARVQTEEGLSNPFLIVVDQWPQATEVEPNNRPEAATPVTPTVVVEGESGGTDVDHVRFPGRKGQRLVIDAQAARIGSGLDPQIRLTTAAGAFVDSSDDVAGLQTDARLVVTLPEDGDYVVELSDTRYQGPERAVYRLLIGEVPVAGSWYPLGGRRGETVGFQLSGGSLPAPAIAAATLDAAPAEAVIPRGVPARVLGLPGVEPAVEIPLGPALAVSDLPEVREPALPGAEPVRVVAPVVLNGQLDAAGPVDRFRLVVTPGRAYRATVEAASLGSPLDGILDVLKPDGSGLANNDDAKVNRRLPGQDNPAEIVVPDPAVDFTPPEGVGEVVLALKDLEARDEARPYRIVVRELAPSLSAELGQSELSVPRGGAGLIGVSLVRQGVDGAVTLEATGLPAGLSARAGTIAPGQTVGTLSLSAAADAPFESAPLTITARAENGTAVGFFRVIHAHRDGLPLFEREQRVLPVAAARALPLRIESPEAPVEVVHGLGGSVPLTIVREEAGKVELTVRARPLPGGLGVPEAKLAPDAAEGSIRIDVAPEAPLGPSTIGLEATGKLGEQERRIGIPAVTLNVVRPIAVELPGDPRALKAGERVEVAGKLTRRGGFNGPVTLKLEGLPAGTAAEPVTIAPEAAEFTLVVTATAEAAEAQATVQVVPVFKLNDKDYAHPGLPLAIHVAR